MTCPSYLMFFLFVFMLCEVTVARVEDTLSSIIKLVFVSLTLLRLTMALLHIVMALERIILL